MDGDPIFYVLKEQAWMNISFEKKILGAIIKNPASPTTNYVPEDPTPATYITRDLQEGSARDFILNGAGGKSHSAEISLTKIAGFRVAGATEASTHLAGRLVRHKRIQQLDQFWEKLRDDETVKGTVPRWVKQRNKLPVCVVVGIMISEGTTEYETETKTTKEGHGNIEIPTGQAVAAATGANPLNDMANVQFSADSSRQTSSDLKASVDESNIFAVELKEVTTEWFWSRRQQLRMKDGNPPIDSVRQAGSGGDNARKDDVVADDLVLRDVDEEIMVAMSA